MPKARAGGAAEVNRREKQALVAAGRAQAALVYDEGICLGWCQFGPVAELPRIKNAKAYRAGLRALPDWRVTCFFVDTSARRCTGGAAGRCGSDRKGRRRHGGGLS